MNNLVLFVFNLLIIWCKKNLIFFGLKFNFILSFKFFKFFVLKGKLKELDCKL